MGSSSPRVASANILIVEDEDILRMTFEEFLRDEGYDVVPVASFDQAIKALGESEFDVVISDIILGGKTGMDLLQEIHRRDLPCKVVMITGDPSLDTAAEAVRHSAFDYLAKPVTGSALVRVVRQALDRKEVEDERDRYRGELDTIFQSLGVGILTVDLDGNVQHVNTAAQEMLEFVGDVTCLSITALKLDARGFLSDALTRSAAVGERINDLQVEFIGKNQTRRVLAVNTVPLLVGRQRRIGAVAILRDITRLLHLEIRLQEAISFYGLVGSSEKIREVYALIQDLSDTDATVLIIGESGTGKELVAEAIHQSSPRAGKPMVTVNCSALAEDILESELFGHVRGAFTGAVKDRMGRFEAADGGTLFLDEIGDISPRLQTRLLRVLQVGEFERVGESKTLHVNVRIIAATNRDLAAKIKSGEFRQDLYYRLNVIRIDLPSLRERTADLPVLIEHFIRVFNRRMRKEIVSVSPEAWNILLTHTWPGNVRELENCIQRAFVVCREAEIRPAHLPREIMSPATGDEATGVSIGLPLSQSSMPLSQANESHDERVGIVNALQQTDWNIAKSARLLGISRNTLYQRIQEFVIQRPEVG